MTTPLDRAKRVQELSAKATEDWFLLPGEPRAVRTPVKQGLRSSRAVAEFILPEDAAFCAETRTLSPALAEDVTQLVALWDLCKPLCQHDPQVADLAQALGLLPERKESES